MTGAVLSILIGLNVTVVAELPALSTQWLPRLVTLPVDVSELTVPLSFTTVFTDRPLPLPSEQVKLTLTAWFVHVSAVYAVLSAFFAVAVMTGRDVSTTHVNVAGDWSTLFAASFARTSNVWEPSRSAPA